MIGWLGVGIAAGIVEAVAMRHHHGTLSELTARAFRVEQPAGKAAFVVALSATAVWYAAHILRFRYSTNAQ